MKVSKRRKIARVFCLLCCLMTLWVFCTLSGSGFEEVHSTRNYILANHYADTGAKNAVTAIYLNYRIWDTLFEAMILLLSAVAVISFSWRSEYEE